MNGTTPQWVLDEDPSEVDIAPEGDDEICDGETGDTPDELDGMDGVELPDDDEVTADG